MSERTVKPRLPRGLVDRNPADVAATDRMLAAIRESYELYGFEAVETPFIEYTDALGKFLPDQDRPNEGVFSFQDDDEQWLSLRYDLTAPLARYVAENFDRLPKPYRSYRCGWVFRNEKPGPGRFRQFMQFDADTVGASSPAADAEICMMAADTLDALGLKGKYVIKVNNRKILDGVMEAIGLGGEANAGRRLTVLRAIDKLDRLGWEGVLLLLQGGRRDASGDFTKGAGLEETQAELIRIMLFNNPQIPIAEATRQYLPNHPDITPSIQPGIDELSQIEMLIKDAGYLDRVKTDRSVVRGLEYYTGPVFEAELTFEVPGEDGRPVRFGSVGGGGRYDGLVGRFRGESVPATGFSIGVSRLYAALKAVNSPIVAGAVKRGPVVVLVMDRDAESMARSQRLVATLRGAGIPAELYLGEAGMNAQLKYADRRGAVCAVIQGSNERDKGVVALKDLIAGAELNKGAKTLDRDAFLALKQRAQIEAPENELIAAVRAVLARYA
ncbi:MAG: histidine--tRNA ligase [Methylobacteriaceae bacterium]|nr:histidine--tRNA ligase [Methylobacteriaceae bacterium]